MKLCLNIVSQFCDDCFYVHIMVFEVIAHLHIQFQQNYG